jgi:hypothetical protein
MNRSSNVTRQIYFFVLLATFALTSACAGSQKPLRASMAPMAVQEQAAAVQPRELTENHFKTDRTGNITEDDLKEILAAPVFLEDEARVGIVPVATAYELDEDLPLPEVPGALSAALESTGFFEVATEVSTDWPTDRSIAGLRELAARYRVKYLMLYRHRFVERERTNAWGWTYPTIVGIFAAPATTMEVAGVMEATLFDVRTGTILFTVHERVHDEMKTNIWQNDTKRRRMKERLLTEATDALTDEVTAKVRRLVAARPAAGSPNRLTP